MKNIKVLHLSSEKSWRGGEQQIAYLITGLKELGIDSVVIARKNSAFADYCSRANIKYFSLPFKNSADVITAKAVGKICREESIDIVHMHSAKSHSIAVLSAVMGNKTPLVLSRRVDFVPSNSWFTRWKYNHPSIRRIVGVSNKITEIMKAYVNQPEKCITIHSGVDLDKFKDIQKNDTLRSEFNIPSDAFLIGNTSALEDHKDYITFINTIEQTVARKPNTHAFIIGSGSLDQSLREIVDEKKLNSFITFTGFRNDLPSILPSLDLFLMTSKEEGLGTSVLDAFLAGVPVVATKAGGIPEMVVNGETGLLTEIGNANQLSEAVCRLIDDATLRDSLITGAREKVRNDFSRQHTAQKTAALYMQLTERDKHS